MKLIRCTLTAALLSYGALAQPSIYVPSLGASDVTVISTGTNRVSTTIGVGDQPRGMAVSANGQRLYVANQNSQSVSVIKVRTNQLVDTIPVEGNPFSVAVTPDSRQLFVAYPFPSQVDVYDLYTKHRIASIPIPDQAYALVMHPDGLTLYVTSANGNGLYLVSTVTHQVVRRITLGMSGLGACITADGSRLYVFTQSSGPTFDNSPQAIWMINTHSNHVEDSVQGSFSESMDLSADGRRLYSMGNAGLATIQAHPLRVLETVPLDGPVFNGNFAFALAASPTSPKLYLVFTLENLVRVYNTETRTIVATVPVGPFPLSIAIPVPRGLEE